jgi:hypothetical protein
MRILRDRMLEEMKLSNFSLATQKSYLYAVTRLTKGFFVMIAQRTNSHVRAPVLC